MGDGPTWSILIPTISERDRLFRRLLDVLLPQLDAHDGRVRVVGWWNNGVPPLPVVRQTLMRDAATDYVSFVDDDDLVVDDFVAAVVEALATRPDHVGFRVAYHVDGFLQEEVDHSLRHRRWRRDRVAGLVRDFTHLDPIRTDLALRGDFRRARRGHPEDRMWVGQVRPHLRSEVYVGRVLYHYLYSPAGSAWQRAGQLQATRPRPVVKHPYFAWHPESGH